MLCCGKSKDRSFLKYKIEKYFDLNDFNNDGSFSKSDISIWAARAAKCYEEAGKPLTDEQKNNFTGKLIKAYNIMVLGGIMGKNKKRFTNYALFVSRLPGFKLILRSVANDYFKACDVDENGQLSFEEYYFHILNPIGVSEDDGKECFEAMDTDGNGSLSMDELTTAITDYFSETERTKYTNIFGPLVEMPGEKDDTFEVEPETK